MHAPTQNSFSRRGGETTLPLHLLFAGTSDPRLFSRRNCSGTETRRRISSRTHSPSFISVQRCLMRAGPLHRGFSRLCGGWPPIGERATSVDEDCYGGGSRVRATQAFLLPTRPCKPRSTPNPHSVRSKNCPQCSEHVSSSLCSVVSATLKWRRCTALPSQRSASTCFGRAASFARASRRGPTTRVGHDESSVASRSFRV